MLSVTFDIWKKFIINRAESLKLVFYCSLIFLIFKYVRTKTIKFPSYYSKVEASGPEINSKRLGCLFLYI